MQIKGVGGAFTVWARVVRLEKQAKLSMSSDERVAHAEREIASLDREVAQLTERLYEVDAERERLQAKVLELGGESAEVQAMLHEQSEKERARRIESFGRQALRRIVHNDVRRGWTAWHDLYQSRCEALRLLERTACRLRTARVRAAFAEWLALAQATAAMLAEQQLRRQCEELQAAVLDEQRRAAQLEEKLQAALATSARAVEAALEAQRVELTGTQQEREALLEAEAKQARVERMVKQAGRRMIHAGLADGWEAWVGCWEARRDALHKLSRAGRRLRVPELACAFDAWSALLDVKYELKRRAQLSGMQKREADLEDEISKLERRMERQRLECDERLLKAAEEKERALERLLTELTGQASDIAALREADAKAARVEQMRAKASKRLLNKDIARGFEAWQALYEEKRHAMAKLRASSNRLRTPALAAAWSFWAKDHAEALRQAKYDELVAQTQSVEAQLRQARYETRSPLISPNLPKSPLISPHLPSFPLISGAL